MTATAIPQRSRAGLGPPVAILMFLALGFSYVALLLDPEITGFHGASRCHAGTQDLRCKFQLWDSYHYMETSRSFSFAELYEQVRKVVAGEAPPNPFFLNNLGLYTQGRIAYSVLPAAPQVAVFWMNAALYLLALMHLRRLIRALDLTGYGWVVTVLFFNPLMLIFAVSLTKEAWGIFFVTAFARYSVERKYLPLLAVAAVSGVFRSIYPMVALAFAATAVSRVRMVWVFVGFSLVMGVVLSIDHPLVQFINATRMYRATDLGQQTSSVMAFLAELQAKPLGNMVAAPVIAAINIASPALNPKVYTERLDEVTWVCTTLSSFLMMGLIALGSLRYLGRSHAPGHIMLARLGFVFLLFVTLFPISQHRYLVPAYPLLVAWALARPRRPPFRSVPVASGGGRAVDPT